MDVMKGFGFALPTRIEFGAGRAAKLPGELSLLSAKKPLLVTDRGIAASGILESIVGILNDAGIEYDVFDEVNPNPRDKDIIAGSQIARRGGNDCLVAVGGGSPIDCAKGISVLATHEGIMQDFRGVENIPGETLPLIAVPTTAGSGSEVTFSAVVTDSEKSTKFSLRSVKIAAKTALCDPELTASMPPGVTASTGMDALTHAIEGFTSTCAEPIANAAALYSIELVFKYLRRAVADGNDIEARSGMLMGSLLGAISFSHSDVAAVHCIAETLGGLYDKPHGVCNAVCLSEVMRYNRDFCAEKYARAALAIGLRFSSEIEGSLAAVSAVERLSEDVGIPRFSSFGIKKAQFREIAARSSENLSNASNPRPLGADDYVGILERLNARG